MARQTVILPIITLRSPCGELTLQWLGMQRDAILKLLQEKLELGHTFYREVPRRRPFAGRKLRPISSIEEVSDQSEVLASRETLFRLIENHKYQRSIRVTASGCQVRLTTRILPYVDLEPMSHFQSER